MRFRSRLWRRSLLFALPCWVIAVPLAPFAQNSIACRHHLMQAGMRHGTPSDAPCWCADMAGGGSLIAPVSPSLPADPLLALAGAASVTSQAVSHTPSIPPSPSYAPTPPPPIGFPA